MTTELWRPIPGYESSYEASNLGNIRRVARGRGAKLGRVLKPQRGFNVAYRSVHLSVDCRPKHRYVHQIVAITWLPPRPSPKHEPNHIDGDKTNNAASNLEWVTRGENHRHAYRTGLRRWADGKHH